MKLNLRQVNSSYVRKDRALTKDFGTAASSPRMNINISQNRQNSDVSFAGLGTAIKKIGSSLITSAEDFTSYESKKLKLDELFGGEYSELEKELKHGLSRYDWSKSDFAHRIRNNADGSVTFIEDGILPKFFKSALYPVKDLWLDLGNWAFGGLKKIPVLSDFSESVLKTKPLKNRAESRRLEDIFNIMAGSVASISKDENAAQELALNTSNVLSNMVHATSKVKGNYRTPDERTINRLFTGAVSATMAGIDFYNISRMQNDDDALAKKSQKKRLKQEYSRIAMSAGMTFLTLGALSKYANKNKITAVAVIAGTTLISETLSRVINGIPMHPLTPEEAKIVAKKQQMKKAQKEADKNADSKTADKPAEFQNINTFKDSLKSQNANSLVESPKEKKQTEFKGNKDGKGKKAADDSKSPLNLQNFLKAVGVLFTAGMTVCFARSRSEKFNSFLKDIRKGMNNAYTMLTKKDFVVPEANINEILTKIDKEYRLHDYARQYTRALRSEAYDRTIKNIDGKDVECVVLGKVDKKFIAPLVKAVTYPFGFIWGAMRFPVKMIRTIFEKEPEKAGVIVNSEDLIGMYKTFNKAFEKVKQGKMTPEELERFIKRKSLVASQDMTGHSTYKNSSLAAISRPIVTLIASYFFVNDYRNEVLITSNGKDTQGANAVAKERVMHKVSNFFFNTMFMNLFNSVFEKAYHGSLIGAGLVAAATEVTNEHAIRMSIGIPTRKMTKEQIEEHDRRNLTRDDFWGKYFRFMSKLTGKKPLSQKVQDENKKKAQEQIQEAKK